MGRRAERQGAAGIQGVFFSFAPSADGGLRASLRQSGTRMGPACQRLKPWASAVPRSGTGVLIVEVVGSHVSVPNEDATGHDVSDSPMDCTH
jgi:hypothetical protein